MPILSAENHFKKGLSALVDRNYMDASVFFRRALDLDRERNRRQPDLRYLSYYGLSLAKAGLSTRAAIQACRTAVSRQKSHPVLLLNLGRVYMVAGKTEMALQAFDRAFRLAPDNKVVARELAQLDRRNRPVIQMLPRAHPVNLMLGRLRYRVRKSHRSDNAVSEVMPISRS